MPLLMTNAAELFEESEYPVLPLYGPGGETKLLGRNARGLAMTRAGLRKRGWLSGIRACRCRT